MEALRELRTGVGGYTHSDSSAFFGCWFSAGPSPGWVADDIVLLIIDFLIPLSDPGISLAEKIAELKETIHQSYAKHGSPQEEVWIVSHRVTRHT